MSGEVVLKELIEFAQTFVSWYGEERDQVDVDSMLVTILAKRGRNVEEMAREKFGFSNDDFRRALKKTRPGMFILRERWDAVNRRFGFDPPLPFPKSKFSLMD